AHSTVRPSLSSGFLESGSCSLKSKESFSNAPIESSFRTASRVQSSSLVGTMPGSYCVTVTRCQTSRSYSPDAPIDEIDAWAKGQEPCLLRQLARIQTRTVHRLARYLASGARCHAAGMQLADSGVIPL